MDTREDIEYFKELKGLQSVYSTLIKQTVLSYFNSFIDRFGSWRRYPRKLKKQLKKSSLWNCRNYDKIKENELEVEMRYSND